MEVDVVVEVVVVVDLLVVNLVCIGVVIELYFFV